MLLVRELERRTKRDGSPFLNVVLGDRTGAVATKVWDDVDAFSELCAPGTALHVEGRFSVHPKWGAEVKLRALSPAAPNTFNLDDLADGAPRAANQMEQDLRELIANDPESAPFAAARRDPRSRYRNLGAVPARAGRQALPPGLRARPARALADRRAVGRLAERDIPRDRPRRRRHRGAAARHRQARRLHRHAARVRPDRRRAPARRNRARLLPRPTGDRAARRLPAGAGSRGHPHHPQPSRLA